MEVITSRSRIFIFIYLKEDKKQKRWKIKKTDRDVNRDLGAAD